MRYAPTSSPLKNFQSKSKLSVIRDSLLVLGSSAYARSRYGRAEASAAVPTAPFNNWRRFRDFSPESTLFTGAPYDELGYDFRLSCVAVVADGSESSLLGRKTVPNPTKV